MAGAQGQVEVRETPYPVIRGARRVCVPIRRVPRGAGVRMSPEPATVTAPPAGQAFGSTVQARRHTMQERACHVHLAKKIRSDWRSMVQPMNLLNRID